MKHLKIYEKFSVYDYMKKIEDMCYIDNKERADLIYDLYINETGDTELIRPLVYCKDDDEYNFDFRFVAAKIEEKIIECDGAHINAHINYFMDVDCENGKVFSNVVIMHVKITEKEGFDDDIEYLTGKNYSTDKKEYDIDSVMDLVEIFVRELREMEEKIEFYKEELKNEIGC